MPPPEIALGHASSFQHPASSAAILPGEPVVTPFGPAWVRTMRYPLAGRPDLAEWLTIRAGGAGRAGSQRCAAGADRRRSAFIDTETTGLSLGTGTYTFLIGVGT